MELTEIAPGADLERDILAKMEFRPLIKRPPALMDERIFREEPMGLRDESDPSGFGANYRRKNDL
jgi:propionate CoA-transferase